MKKLLALTAIISLSQLTFASALSVTLSPASAGNFSQWTLGAGADKVSALSTNDGNTSYISETVDGQVETFKMSNANIPAWVTVSSVTFNAVAKQQLGTSTIALRVEKGTTSPDISDDVAQSPSASYGTLTRVMTTNPFTGLAWTTGEVNNWTNAFGFVFGDIGSGNRARVTQASAVVDYVNVTPVATSQSVTVNEDASTTITLAGTDTELQPLSFATSTNPANGTLLNFSTTTGQVTYVPNTNFTGIDSFDFVVNDSLIDSATATVSITVSPVNDAPSFSIASSTVVVDEDLGLYSLENFVTGIIMGPSDESAQLPSFTVVPTRSNLFASTPTVSASGTLYFTPRLNATGTSTLRIKLNDNGGTLNGGIDGSATSSMVVFVTPINDTPTVAGIGNKTVAENSLLSFTVVGRDADRDVLTYSASNLPAGATFDTNTHIFSWTPDFTQAGAYPLVHFEVTDPSMATSSRDITITVTNVDRAPVLGAIGNKTVNEDVNLSFVVSGTDPDGDTVDLTATVLPTGATFSTSTGEFSWTPDFTQAGNYSVTFTATAGMLSDDETVSIDVGNVNRTPVLTTVSDITVDESTPISFTASATDPDGDAITYTLSGTVALEGATVNPTTGEFSWTPSEAQGPGTYSAIITATDNSTSTLSDDTSFSVTIQEVNQAPVTSDISVTMSEDGAATTTLVATDADVPTQTLTYSIVTQPVHGTLTLTDDEALYTPDQDWFGTDTYQYVADDGVIVGATSTVTVDVQSVNDVPVITLIGNSSITLVQYSTSTDPGVLALDVEDGDITANVTTDNVYSSNSAGTYTITYSITDADSGTASVSRDITVVANGTGTGAGGSIIVGCRDPRATNYNPSASYDGVMCTYPTPAPVGQVLGASTSTVGVVQGASTSTEVGTTGSLEQASSTEKFTFTQNLRFGMRGKDVGELQKILIAEKLLNIDAPTLYFGPLTRAALIAWQTKNGVPATGILGSLSRAILNR